MELFDFILHFDEHLANIIDLFGVFTYVILFFIIFAETGLVVTPFLPGDSLLFVVGTLAGSGFLNIWIVYFSLLIAAILGDTVNYWIGHHLGNRVFSKENSRLFNKAYLEKTREFYEKHGGKTIILARFLPIIRTFAPFVAGIGSMNYRRFLAYNVIGGIVWVVLFVTAGYSLGKFGWVKNNLSLILLGIIILSIMPIVVEVWRNKRQAKVG